MAVQVLRQAHRIGNLPMRGIAHDNTLSGQQVWQQRQVVAHALLPLFLHAVLGPLTLSCIGPVSLQHRI